MKKEFIPAFLFVCSALLTAGFAAHLYFDYTLRYEYGSSPFWLYVVIRLVEFLAPAVVCLIAGLATVKKK